ncbi:MAG: DUF3185 family protein [Treponema sp.]|jgi:hypothetical protein|nr:DUF3185 family protein [Treponema sp.]
MGAFSIFVQTFSLIVAGIILLWFGYTIFFSPLSPFYPGWFPWRDWRKKKNVMGAPGDPQVCPVCSMKLDRGELVKSVAFPSLTGGRDRLMYIRGCFSCLERAVPRRCPVCGTDMDINDYLICRMFERPGGRNHVHVLGCNHCKKTGNLAR